LLFGYDTGMISGALLFIEQDFAPLSPFLQGIIVSTLLVGAVIGAISGNSLSDRFGRRPILLLAAPIFGLRPWPGPSRPAYRSLSSVASCSVWG